VFQVGYYLAALKIAKKAPLRQHDVPQDFVLPRIKEIVLLFASACNHCVGRIGIIGRNSLDQRMKPKARNGDSTRSSIKACD